MATRPIFLPCFAGESLVIPAEIEFQWFSGLSISQKQKSIQSLHYAASQRNISNVLEISSKSLDSLGVNLSAFNLKFKMRDGLFYTVENVFQSSKVFENGGPYIDLLGLSPKAAKTDPRLQNSGKLRGFRLDGINWGLLPATTFYDWLYLNALKSAPELSSQLLIQKFNGFSDIEFNPKRSLNCQAASAALYVSLVKLGVFDVVMKSKKSFLSRMQNKCISSASNNVEDFRRSMVNIESMFNDHFWHWQIRIPPDDVLQRKNGRIAQAGWFIRYLFGFNERGEYLDYYASQRMTGDRHVRIYADALCEELPAINDYYSSSSDPIDAAQLEEKFYAENQKVAKLLDEKGFGVGSFCGVTR